MRAEECKGTKFCRALEAKKRGRGIKLGRVKGTKGERENMTAKECTGTKYCRTLEAKTRGQLLTWCKSTEWSYIHLHQLRIWPKELTFYMDGDATVVKEFEEFVPLSLLELSGM